MSQFNPQQGGPQQPQMQGNNQAFQALQAKAMEKKGAALSAFQGSQSRFASQGMGIARDLVSQSYQGELGPTAGLAAEGLPGEFARFTPGTDLFKRHQQLQSERRATTRQHNRELGKIQAEITGLGQNKANRQQGFQRVLQRYAGEMTNTQSSQALISGLSDAINQKQDRLTMLAGGGVLGLGAFGTGAVGTVGGGMGEQIEKIMATSGLSRYQAAKRLMEVPGQTMEDNVTKTNIFGAIGDLIQGTGESLGLGAGGLLMGAGAIGIGLALSPAVAAAGTFALIAGSAAALVGSTSVLGRIGDTNLDEVKASVNEAIETFRAEDHVDATLQANLLVVSEEISKVAGKGAGGAEAVFDGMNQLLSAIGKSTNPNDQDVIAIMDKVAELKETAGVSLEQLYHGLVAAENASEARRSSMAASRSQLETAIGTAGRVANTEEQRLSLKVFREGEKIESQMRNKLTAARTLLENAGDKVTNPELRFYEASERAQAAEDILDGTLDGLIRPDGSITQEAEELFAVIDPNVASKLRDFLDKKATEEAELLDLESRQTELGELLDPALSPELAEYEAELADLMQQNTERNIEIQRERDTESQIITSLMNQIDANMQGMR